MKELTPWELLMKRLTWAHVGDLQGLRILDFGSGEGVTADHYASDNAVTAIEPDVEAIARRSREHAYVQLTGSTEALQTLPDASFDVILCHCVLEYAPDREAILAEFARLLTAEGFLSIVKHNRPGRVFQMAVLLNDFDHANALLDGAEGRSAEYGAIRYYADEDLTAWCPSLRIESVQGLRTFFDLQQNQAVQREADWQAKMLALELRVAQVEPYRSAAFLHHIILKKRGHVVSAPSPRRTSRPSWRGSALKDGMPRRTSIWPACRTLPRAGASPCVPSWTASRWDTSASIRTKRRARLPAGVGRRSSISACWSGRGAAASARP